MRSSGARRHGPTPAAATASSIAGFIRPDQIERMARLKIEPVPQPVFLYDYGDLYVSVVGEERAAASYPMRTWMNFGHEPAASSDAPVCDVDPSRTLSHAAPDKARRARSSAARRPSPRARRSPPTRSSGPM
jgi:predicted amidohydrolase YtcJ